MKIKQLKKGYTLVYLIIIIFLISMMLVPVTNLMFTISKVIQTTTSKEQSLQIAEAGINYYQWRLAHFPNDFQDGTGQSGPYVHDYVDYDTQEKIGQFSLEITAPSVGSTIVTIKSTGWTNEKPNVKRAITTKYGVPSLTKYSFLSNDIIWIGSNESVAGQLHSNNGVRFDGYSNAPIQSAKSTYVCSTSQGDPCPVTQNGVWGDASQEVKNFFQFPVPAIDFSSLTSDLATIKNGAQSNGIYLPPSNENGYSLVFKSNGTIDIYKIKKLLNTPDGYDVYWNIHTENIDYDERTFQFNKPIPSNGLVYIEDNVWVEGTVKGRILVAAAKLPYNKDSAPTIYIPNNLKYLEKDGNNVLGLLAQKDIIVTYYAPSDIEIDAAMIAQNGSTQVFYYKNTAAKNSITIYGSIMTYGMWTWSWVNNYEQVVCGYKNTTSIYDSNLLYNPPPNFPLSTSGYQQINWISN